MDKVIGVYLQCRGTVDFAAQHVACFTKLAYGTESIMGQIDIVGGEKQAAQTADDIGPVLKRLKLCLLLLFLHSNILAENVNGNLVILSVVDDMLLYPVCGFALHTVLADFLGAVFRFGSFFPEMLQRQGVAVLYHIVRMNMVIQSLVHIVVVIPDQRIRQLAFVMQAELFALAGVQVNRIHFAVA